MFDLGAKVKINPFCFNLHGEGMKKHDPSLREDSVLTIKRRGKLRLTFAETDVRIPLTWMVPADGISVNQAGKRVCRRDVDEAAERAHKTGKSISLPYFYYGVGASLLREIGMEARSEAAFEDGTLRRGLGGVFRHKSHPLTVFLCSYFVKNGGSTVFWMGVTLDSERFETWLGDNEAWLTDYSYSPHAKTTRKLSTPFPDLKVFREDDSKGPMSLMTHEGWDAVIGHLRQACEG